MTRIVTSSNAGTAPVVVVPGVQGRWEWMPPALSTRWRGTCRVDHVLAGGEPDGACGRRSDARLRQLRPPARRRARSSRPRSERRLCGVSFGGFIALRYAATRPGARGGADPRLDAGAGLAAIGRQSRRTCASAVAVRRRLFVADVAVRGCRPEISAAIARPGGARLRFALLTHGRSRRRRPLMARIAAARRGLPTLHDGSTRRCATDAAGAGAHAR